MANPLALVETPKSKMTAEDWAERGNRILAGIDPYTCKKYAGEYHRRDDVRWVVRNGRCVIEWAQ